jgi:hypothetical protein
MLFTQPVVVNDAHGLDRATPAEVRLAEPRAAEKPPTWTGWAGTMLAQSGMDSRSPFGPNAVDHNDLTPPPSAPHQPGDTVAPPAAPHAAKATDEAGTTSTPPKGKPGQTDAGPPGATTPTPVTAPSTATPETAPSTATPAAPRSEATPGAGNTSGTTGPGTPGTSPNPYRASSSTVPARTESTRPGGSGASNSE